MCQERNTEWFVSTDGKDRHLDGCLIKIMNLLDGCDYKTLSSCCGHGKYPMTIVIWDRKDNNIYDLISGITMPRKKKFYVKDEKGYYYIPEVLLHYKKMMRE